MPVLRKKTGFVVVSVDGAEELTPANLTREQAEEREAELRKRRPLLTWVRERGTLK